MICSKNVLGKWQAHVLVFHVKPDQMFHDIEIMVPRDPLGYQKPLNALNCRRTNFGLCLLDHLGWMLRTEYYKIHYHNLMAPRQIPGGQNMRHVALFRMAMLGQKVKKTTSSANPTPTNNHLCFSGFALTSKTTKHHATLRCFGSCTSVRHGHILHSFPSPLLRFLSHSGAAVRWWSQRTVSNWIFQDLGICLLFRSIAFQRGTEVMRSMKYVRCMIGKAVNREHSSKYIYCPSGYLAMG